MKFMPALRTTAVAAVLGVSGLANAATLIHLCRHLTGSATEMAAFYEPGFFDVVVASNFSLPTLIKAGAR